MKTRDRAISEFVRRCIIDLHNNALIEKTDKKIRPLQVGIITAIIVLPILLPGIFSIWNKALLGLGIGIFIYVLFLSAMLCRKKYIYNKFYKVEDVDDKIKIIPVENIDFLDELYNNSALTFPFEADYEVLRFIYNWLNNIGMLNGKTVNIYTFTSMDLMKKFGFEINVNVPMFCINHKELNITDENILQFSKENFVVGARWFDDIVDNNRLSSSKNLSA